MFNVYSRYILKLIVVMTRDYIIRRYKYVCSIAKVGEIEFHGVVFRRIICVHKIYTVYDIIVYIL